MTVTHEQKLAIENAGLRAEIERLCILNEMHCLFLGKRELLSTFSTEADGLKREVEATSGKTDELWTRYLDLRDALGKISRMRALPDHASNTMTLAAATHIAKSALQEVDPQARQSQSPPPHSIIMGNVAK